jgi:hypothetical protein
VKKGKEWPVGGDSAAKFIRLGDVIGADRNQPAIANLELPMKFDEPFMLAALPWGKNLRG